MDTSVVVPVVAPVIVPFGTHITPSLAHAAPQSAAERELALLRAADGALPAGWRDRIAAAEGQRLPVTAADLAGRLTGAALGRGLKAAEAAWIASDFALPAPALTPYLVGLLVLLGMLGTLLGMMATLSGTDVDPTTAKAGAVSLVLLVRTQRNFPDPIEANALHGGRMSMRDNLIVAAQTLLSNGFGASVAQRDGQREQRLDIPARPECVEQNSHCSP